LLSILLWSVVVLVADFVDVKIWLDLLDLRLDRLHELIFASSADEELILLCASFLFDCLQPHKLFVVLSLHSLTVKQILYV